MQQIEEKITGTDFAASEYSKDGEHVSLGVQVDQHLLETSHVHATVQTDDYVSFSLATQQTAMNVSASAQEWYKTLAMIPALLSHIVIDQKRQHHEPVPPPQLQHYHSTNSLLKISVCIPSSHDTF